jgi:tetratricopeptide (TPR) repeat protein
MEHAKKVENMYQNAQSLINNGMKKEGIEALLELLNLHSDFAMAHNDLAVLYLNDNDKENALKHYQKAAELEPENSTFTKNLADLYYVKLGRAEEALELYVKILASNPADVEILASIGHICIDLEKYDNAKIFFTRVLEVDPWNEDAKKIIDELAEKQGMGNIDLGTEVGEPAAKWYQHAQELRKKEGDKECIKELEKLLEAYPDFGLAHNDLGALYFGQGKKETALNHYEYAARLEPHNDTLQKNLADFYFIEAGRVEEALRIYTKLLKTDPTDTEILLIMAQICESLKKIKDAKVFYTKVLEVDPWNMAARKKIVELAEGQAAEARGQTSGSFPVGPIAAKKTAVNNDVEIGDEADEKEMRLHSYHSWQKKDSAVP